MLGFELSSNYEGFVDIQMTKNHSYFDCHLLKLDQSEANEDDSLLDGASDEGYGNF